MNARAFYSRNQHYRWPGEISRDDGMGDCRRRVKENVMLEGNGRYIWDHRGKGCGRMKLDETGEV